MKPDKTTWLIIATAFIWLFYDVYLYVYNEITISEQIYDMSNISMIVPFGVGMLCGHWFWSNK